MNELQATVESSPPNRVLPLWRFSLRELLGLMTIAAVAFACWGVHPALGIFTSIIALPAYIRTLISVRRKHSRGIASTWHFRVFEFIRACVYVLFSLYTYAMVLVLCITIAGIGIGILRAICFPPPKWLEFTGIAIGALFCLYVPFRYMRWTTKPMRPK